MYAKRIRRRCMVRGCGNVDTFSISRTRENGNTVIICEECLQAALGAVSDVPPGIPEKKKESVPPPLFFTAGVIDNKKEEPKKSTRKKEVEKNEQHEEKEDA